MEGVGGRDNVVSIRGDPNDVPVRDQARKPFCLHRHVELDHDARRVYCRDCGREGPRPAGSMLKLVAGEMQFACQASCWRALGWSAP